MQVTSAAANGNSTNKATSASEGDKMSAANGKSSNGAATNGAPGAPQEG